MRKRKVKIIAFIMAVAMCFSMIPMVEASAASLAETVSLSEIKGKITDMTENVKYSETIKSDEEVYWYRFKPTTSGIYWPMLNQSYTNETMCLYAYEMKDANTLSRLKFSAYEPYSFSEYALKFSVDLKANSTYYFAIYSRYGVKPEGINNTFYIKKAQEIKSMQLVGMGKGPVIPTYAEDGTITYDYDELYMLHYEVTFADGSKDIVMGYLDNQPTWLEKDMATAAVGDVFCSVASGDIIMTKDDVTDYKKGVIRDYNVTVRIKPTGLDKYYETKTVISIVEADTTFGQFQNINGYKFTNKIEFGYGVIYRGAVTVEKAGMYSLDFCRKYGCHTFKYYRMDEKGNCVKAFAHYSTSNFANAVYLEKGNYYFAILAQCEPGDRYAVFGETTGVIDTTSLSMSETETLEVGDVLHMTDSLQVLPANNTDKLIWTSDNASVAEVNDKGLVKGIAAGTATITVKSGKYQASCLVTVIASKKENISTKKTNKTLAKQKFTIKKKTITVKSNKSVSLSKYVACKDKAKLTFKKLSGNSKIAISNKGKISVKKGIKKGLYKVKLKVSAKATDNYAAGTVTKTIKIKVN